LQSLKTAKVIFSFIFLAGMLAALLGSTGLTCEGVLMKTELAKKGLEDPESTEGSENGDDEPEGKKHADNFITSSGMNFHKRPVAIRDGFADADHLERLHTIPASSPPPEI
jgi:hypothetical protein